VQLARFGGPAADLGPEGCKRIVAVVVEQDVEVEERLGQVGVRGAVADIEGFGELAAGTVQHEQGEDADRPLGRRNAKGGQGGSQDVGAPGAAPVGAVV
jgi:hypothetical protein